MNSCRIGKRRRRKRKEERIRKCKINGRETNKEVVKDEGGRNKRRRTRREKKREKRQNKKS